MIESELNKMPSYVGNGLTNEFPFTFPIISTDDVKVYYTDANGNTTKLTSGYLVVLNDRFKPYDGGHVTYPYPSGTKLQSGCLLTLNREVAPLQPVDLKNGGKFNAEVYEQVLDRQMMIVQRVLEIANRSLQADITQISGAYTFPTPTAGKALGWSSDGKIVNLENFSSAQISALFNAAFESDQTTIKLASAANMSRLNNSFIVQDIIPSDVSAAAEHFLTTFSITVPSGKTLRVKRIRGYFNGNVKLRIGEEGSLGTIVSSSYQSIDEENNNGIQSLVKIYAIANSGTVSLKKGDFWAIEFAIE